MDGVRGLPLLSGPPPHLGESEHCRKCNKEFNRLFNKSKRCNHCGYQYCSNCCSHSALMPRIGVYNGFDPADVCSYCIEMLKVTAMPRAGLRAMPLSHLKAYLNAYGLSAPPHAVEKEDYVRAVLDARQNNGCLLRAKEDYYRQHSIPEPSGDRPRGFLSRMADSFSDFIDSLPQPDLSGPAQPPPVPPRPTPPRPPPRTTENRPPPTASARPQPSPSRPQTNPPNTGSGPRYHAPPPPNPAPAPAPASTRPSPQAIPMDQLLEMTDQAVSSLSIGVLKATLQHYHVRVPQDALEKRDIVERVVSMIQAARAEKEREERARAAEAEAEIEAQKKALEEIERRNNRDQEYSGDSSKTESADLPKPASSKAAKLERDGLCVICQDEESSIAIVDCGHLCLCMDCSELVMSSTKECPLCRTRIVTPQRLLRIFKT